MLRRRIERRVTNGGETLLRRRDSMLPGEPGRNCVGHGWNHGHRVHGAALVARVSKNGVMGTAGAEAWRVHHGMACRHVRMLIVPRNQTGKLSKDKDREEPRANVSDPSNPAHVEWSSDRSH